MKTSMSVVTIGKVVRVCGIPALAGVVTPNNITKSVMKALIAVGIGSGCDGNTSQLMMNTRAYKGKFAVTTGNFEENSEVEVRQLYDDQVGVIGVDVDSGFVYISLRKNKNMRFNESPNRVRPRDGVRAYTAKIKLNFCDYVKTSKGK